MLLLLGGHLGRVSAAARLLGTETNGIAHDFLTMQTVVRDTVTPANNFDGNPNSWWTYSSPSTKWIEGADGLLTSGTTLRTEYSGGTRKGLRIEESRTNLALHSDDFTQAAWVKTDVTAALTATGPDGVSNSASTLTASGANGTALQSITSASAARITDCYVKRRTGSGNIQMTQDGGGVWTTVTVTSSWTRVSIPSATVTNPQVGFRIVTSGDAIDVAFFNCQTGAFSTSPIRTAGATVTRAYDTIQRLVSAMNHNAAAGTLFAEGSGFAGAASSGNAGYTGISDTGAGTNYWVLRRAGSAPGYLVISGGASTATGGLGTAYGSEAVVKHGVSATTDLFKISVAGAPLIADDTSGAMPVGASINRWLLSGLASTFGSWNGHVRYAMYLPRNMSTAELNTVTT